MHIVYYAGGKFWRSRGSAHRTLAMEASDAGPAFSALRPSDAFLSSASECPTSARRT